MQRKTKYISAGGAFPEEQYSIDGIDARGLDPGTVPTGIHPLLRSLKAAAEPEGLISVAEDELGFSRNALQ